MACSVASQWPPILMRRRNPAKPVYRVIRAL